MIIDGTALAEQVKEGVASEIKALGLSPQLDVVLVGEDPASQVYVSMKHKACERVGINSVQHFLPAETTEEELLALVGKLNRDPAVSGILVQFPVPKHISQSAVIQAISPAKDVDGLHPFNAGLLMSGSPGLVPCTPSGVIYMLD